MIASQNTNQTFTSISVSGNAVFSAGQTTFQYNVGGGGSTQIGGITGTLFDSTDRGDDAAHRSSPPTTSTCSPRSTRRSSTARSRRRRPSRPPSTRRRSRRRRNTTCPRPGSNAANGLAQQIQTVARVIGARNAIGAKRQVFFVSMGGFDTHDNQNMNQADLLARISHAIGYFDTVMSNIGGVDMRNNVTLFTASDFGRTITSNGDGTDHGWGAHHFVIGGAVNGGDIYGRFPQFRSTPGRTRPTTPTCRSLGRHHRRDGRQVVRGQRHQPQHDLPEPGELPPRPRLPEAGLTRAFGAGSTGSLRAARLSLCGRRAGSVRLQHAPVLDRLAEMGGRDLGAGGEVGDRAGDAQHAVKAARRPAEPGRRRLQEARGGGVEAAMRGRARRRRAGRCSRPGARSRSPGRRRPAREPRCSARRRARPASSSAATAGTSTCRSMRSSSGPLMRAW